MVLVQRQEDGELRKDLGIQAARFAEHLLNDDDLRTRQDALRALEKVGDRDSIPPLERHRRQTEVVQEQQAASRALSAIRSRNQPDHLKGSAELDARMEALEARMEAMQEELDEWQDHH